MKPCTSLLIRRVFPHDRERVFEAFSSARALLVVGRVVHALGMLYSGSPAPRAAGMMLTYVAFLAPAVWLLVRVA